MHQHHQPHPEQPHCRRFYDKYCMIRAYRILNQDVYVHRYDDFFLGVNTGHLEKQPVVTALGRILEEYSEETMIELADVIYERRMTAKQALKFIRQYVPLPATF